MKQDNTREPFDKERAREIIKEDKEINRNEILDKYLGKKVKVTLCDIMMGYHQEVIGVLEYEKDKDHKGFYNIGGIYFKESIAQTIMEVQDE